MVADQRRLSYWCPRNGRTSNAWSSPLHRGIPTLVAAMVFSLASAIAGWSQSSMTALRGTVTDPQAAVVAGAEVVLSDPASAFSRAQKTDDRGLYQFLQVPPGTYAVSVGATGFTTSRKENVVLQVNTPATLNFVLQVGAATTTVDVQGEAPPVNTVDASLGNPFDSKQILDLPSEGRNAVELLSLQAGVTYVGNQVDTAADSRGGAVNGARSDQTNVTVDGLDDNDQLLGQAFTPVLRIPMDSLEEFRVVTTNSNADSGRSSGAQVSLVTKSGTNQFHGTAYEYNRSSLGTANDWFNERAELQAGLPNKPGELIRNTFGAAVGGPIIKNRLFFFSNFEGQRSRGAVQVTQAVPSANLRKGIVGYACTPGPLNPNCALGTPGVTSSSLVPAGDLLMTLQPADIKSIDQGCLSSGTCPNGNGPSQAVLTQWNGGATLPDGTAIPAFPLPNTDSASSADGLNILGYTFAAPQPTNQNTYLLKLDYKLTQNGNHSLFIRGDLQNDRELFAAEFPGEPPSQILRNNSKGIAVGYAAVLSNTLINNFHYAFIRQRLGTAGDNPYSNVSFTNLADQVSFLRTVNVNVPVNQFVEDVTWTRGKHTLQFGGNWRIIDNNRFSNEQNFLNGMTHPDWLEFGGISNTGQDLDPSISSVLPSVDPSFGFSYDAAIADVTGILGSISAWYNQNKLGQFVPVGDLVPRHFKSNESEFYVQDSWHAAPNLQLTFGLRYTLLQPPYETQGNQVSPTPSLNSFFETRATDMLLGETYRPVISFDLSGQANGKQPYWNWDYHDVAPRFAVAYSPNFDSGLFQKVFGAHGKSSIRGGYGIYYDHFGEGVVNSFDREGSLGLTTYLVNPSGVSTTNCVSRFISLTVLPTSNACPITPGEPPAPELPSPPAGGFPFVPPGAGQNGGFAIGWGIDSGMRTPYSQVVDFSITRELPNRFVLELSYVGRFGRHLLQEVDLAQPLNLVDPKSGTTYYQAATALVKLANANTPESSVQNIAYWQDLFPAAAGAAGVSGYAPGIPANPTATQNIYDLYYANGVNATYALQSLDAYCFPACSTLGPYAYWDDQFSSMFSWRTTGTSSYNGMQATLRRHFGGLEFDFNYTYSKSQDENSNAERVNEYENGSGVAVAYSGQVVNAWSPKALYSVSDFDTTHQINANWIYELPFGRGKRWAGGGGSLLNGILGSWQISGLTRWTSGYPFSISTYAFPTNYEQDSRAVLLGAAPRTGGFIDSSGDPNVFQEGPAAASAFRFAYPGESGERNNLRGPGYFGVDMSLAKLWTIAESQSLRFSWDVFNVTNAVRFDVGSLNQYLLYQPSLGDFTQTLTHPRVMQCGLRYSF
jgi:Carboxypeptidase regulatory-like domain